MPLPSTEITVKLTPNGIAELIRSRGQNPVDDYHGPERRHFSREHLEGVVEVYPLDGGARQPCFACVRNLSEAGLGMSSDRYFEPGAAANIVLHLAEANFHSKAAVRYCQQVRGQYMTGVEFIF